MNKMNLDTLIEAAKFVELQEVNGLGASPRVPQEFHIEETPSPLQEEVREAIIPNVLRRSPTAEKRSFHANIWSKTGAETPFNREPREDDLQDLRRRPGAGTREVHNKLEKNRRAHLKECFELVKKQLPAGLDDKKASNLNILHNAIKYIQTLRRKDREYEHEMERLAREKIALQQRFANLKKELSAQWDHIDFNTLIPESAISDHEEVLATSDNEETNQQRSVGYSSTSSLSSAATLSVSPHLPPSVAEEATPPHSHLSPKNIPSDGPKMISFTSRLEGSKRPLTNSHVKPPSTQLQLPVIANAPSGHLAATLVSPTIQLVTSSNLRVLPGDPSLAFSVSHGPPHNNSMTLMHKTGAEDETLSLVHGNGVRGKGPILTLPNGTFHTGIAAKNGVIYKPSHTPTGANNILSGHLSPGFAHVVTPIAGSHLVTPVPVTVVSQGNQVAHILTAPQGKMVTPLSIKPLMPQYLVKPGAAMVVVSQNSTVSQTSSK